MPQPISSEPWQFDPDDPIATGYKDDRLGYRSVANMLATALLNQPAHHGLVVSIEGPWGSGKSSLVNLLEEELTRREGPPQIVRFEPWLVGDRDRMLVELLSGLLSAVTSIARATDSPPVAEEAKALAKNLATYAATLSRRVAPFAELAGQLGLPWGDPLAKSLDAAAKAIDTLTPSQTPLQLKNELVTGLEKINWPIFVIVDDLDRLEPNEAAEMTRLVKAVAGFPSITYVLCYDPAILARHLENSVSIDDGHAFLEKIVQITFNVPRPEGFDLRQWLLKESVELYNVTTNKELSDDQLRRLHSVCNIDGQLVTTPRDVVRIMNALKLHWRPLQNKIDYPDLLWLQITKIKNGKLYAITERYLADYVMIVDGASITTADKDNIATELNECLPSNSPTDPRSLWRISQFIPGIQPVKQGPEGIFNRESDKTMGSLENDRRIGSSQHSRYYFAFSKPGGALDDDELHTFIRAAEDGSDFRTICTSLISSKRPQGHTKFELLIDRMQRLPDASIPVDAISPILMALAHHLDSVGTTDWDVRWAWESGELLLKKLLGRLPPSRRTEVIGGIFGGGESIGWLMNVLRHEMWGHGYTGNRPVNETERLLSERELKEVIAALKERLSRKDRRRLVRTPSLLGLLYGWKETGDETGVLEWVREEMDSDRGFLALLAGCRGWLHTGKLYHPLNRRDLSRFLDFDEMRGRLKRIVESTDAPEDDRNRARELLVAADLGDDR